MKRYMEVGSIVYIYIYIWQGKEHFNLVLRTERINYAFQSDVWNIYIRLTATDSTVHRCVLFWFAAHLLRYEILGTSWLINLINVLPKRRRRWRSVDFDAAPLAFSLPLSTNFPHYFSLLILTVARILKPKKINLNTTHTECEREANKQACTEENTFEF